MRVPQSPQGTSLSPCIPSLPSSAMEVHPVTSLASCSSLVGEEGGRIRSGVASLQALPPSSGLHSRSPSLHSVPSPAPPLHLFLATAGDFQKCKSDSTASLILHRPLPTGEEPVIQGLDCRWLTSQAPLSSPKVQPHLLPFKPSLPSLLLNLGQPPACCARQAAPFLTWALWEKLAPGEFLWVICLLKEPPAVATPISGGLDLQWLGAGLRFPARDWAGLRR